MTERCPDRAVRCVRFREVALGLTSSEALARRGSTAKTYETGVYVITRQKMESESRAGGKKEQVSDDDL